MRTIEVQGRGYELASLMERWGGQLLDGLISLAIVLVGILVGSILLNSTIGAVIGVVVAILYRLFQDGLTNGQSWGKKIVKRINFMKAPVANCMFSSLLFTLLVSFFTTSVFAQTATLGGVVTDAQTGEVIADAAIDAMGVAVESPVRAVSDATGAFEIKGLVAGTYTVTVSHIGYAEQILFNITLTAGERESLEVSLSPTVIELDQVSVTASRRPEKVLEAPAAVSVLYASQIQDRAAPTPTEHLKSMPMVDVVTSGLIQSRAVVRGFNHAFSGSLLSLVDNRIARVPSLRVNAYSLIPTVNEDIERIEVVGGPGAALYGPNSANGVMHILTKSPFDSEGTTVSLGSGERSVLLGTFRHAGSYKNRIGYKISGQYYQGDDWEFNDPQEMRIRQEKINAGQDPGKIGQRNFDVEKLNGEARVDLHLTNDLTAILSSGFSQANQIELTGIGAAQAEDWTYSYFQGRMLYKNLFAQAFLNQSDAGDTFVLRTNEPILDKSSLFVGQLQHSLELGARQRFTYGADVLLTRPNTEGSINGVNEDDDDINEIGAYLQSETKILPQVKVVTAARIDNHNRLENPAFSPRAAVVFSPNTNHNLRATYNRAFSTPTTNNLFLDILSVEDAFGLGRRFQPVLGFSPSTNVRAQGIPETGFHFKRSADGRPQFQSPFAPLAERSPSDNITLDDPVFTNVMWNVGRGAVLNSFLPTFRNNLNNAFAAQGLPMAQIDAQVGALSQAFAEVVPQQVGGVKNVLRSLNPETQQFTDVDDVIDIEPIKSTINQTFEVGYKGVLMNKLVFAVDGYHTKIKDFVGPLVVETPNVFLDADTLSASLAQQFMVALNAPENAALNSVLMTLDAPAQGGNGNGSAVDELTKLFVAGTDNNGAAFIPFGTVTAEEATDPTGIMLTYRNYGDISLNGADFSFTYYLNQNWNFSGNYSYVSKDLFKDVDGVSDIALNAPKQKFGASVEYLNTDLGLATQLRLRYVDSFPVNSGVYIGQVDSYVVVDLNLGYNLPFSPNTRFSLTAQNLLDNKHQEYVGTPEIGRLAMVRLTQSF